MLASSTTASSSVASVSVAVVSPASNSTDSAVPDKASPVSDTLTATASGSDPSPARLSTNTAGDPSATGEPSDAMVTTGAGPGILAVGLFDSTRPSAAHTAPSIPQGRPPGSVADTAPSPAGRTSIRHSTLPGGSLRLVRTSSPPSTSYPASSVR